MSSDQLLESGICILNFKETELTLALPGSQISGTKRGRLLLSESSTIELSIGSSTSGDTHNNNNNCQHDSVTYKTPAKTQVVGWPPVRSYRKDIVIRKCKYVKVAVDGAPYLRKVDLEMYISYQQLLSALEGMFSCITICNFVNESKLMDTTHGVEYEPTYEDKDGDWMLVGDVPWKMFVESCKRIRLMKSSEAIGLLAPRTPVKCSSTSD